MTNSIIKKYVAAAFLCAAIFFAWHITGQIEVYMAGEGRALVYGFSREIIELVPKASYDLVTSYPQKLNEQGIAVDMEDNPYYMTRMPGYAYPEPEKIEYYSTVTKAKRHAFVILPADYDDKREYPVLYLLHGLHGTCQTWLNKNGDVIISNLHYFQNASEMIVVLTDNNVVKGEKFKGLTSVEIVNNFDKLEQDLIDCLMPYINENYSVATGKRNTAIAGNSMGGREAMNLAFKHQDVFGYVGAFSTAYVLRDDSYNGKTATLLENLDIDKRYGGFSLIMVMTGTEDDVCPGWTEKLHECLTRDGTEHIFYTTRGAHENKVWQNALYNFAMRLFKE